MDKKSVILTHSSLWSQTYWASMTHVVGDYNQFAPLLCYSQRLKLRGDICHRDKNLPRRRILRKISCVYIWPHIFFVAKISCGPGLLIGLICWPNSSSPYISKIPRAFIAVDGVESCSSISVCWTWTLLLDIIVLIIWFFFGYQPLLEIIVVIIHIGLTAGVMLLNWSCQG